MENPHLQGIFGIVPTPFTGQGEVDEKGLEHLVRHAADSGLHAAVVLGSNGEFPYLTFAEKVRVIRAAARAGKGKIPVVAGVSSFGTREAVELAREAKAAGCDAVLAALNVYFALDLTAVLEHFTILAREGGLPVIFYYFPELTNLDLGPDEIEQIAAIKGVHGAKITVFNKSFLKRVIRLTRTHLWAVFAGTSFMLYESLKAGGAGVLCPIPLIAPRDCLAVFDAMQAGKLGEARKAQDKILHAVPIFSDFDMPGAMGVAYFKAMIRKPYTGPGDRMASGVVLVKEALRLQGHPISAAVRRPGQPITPEQSDKVKQGLTELGWL